MALAASVAACAPTDREDYLEVKVPLHLEDQMLHAAYSGPDLPQDLPRPVEWQFAEPHPDWTTRRYDGDQALETF
jgi:hypothetical protein